MSARIAVATAVLALCAASTASAQHHDHSPPPPVEAKPAVDPHAGHSMPAPAPKPKPKPKAKPATPKPAAAADPHAGHSMPAPAPKPKAKPKAKPAATKPAAAADPHAGHVMPTPAVDPHAGHAMPTPAVDPHAGHAMPAAAVDPHAHHSKPAPTTVIPAKAGTHSPVPALTDADRAAAFPALTTGHDHGRAWHSYVLVDRLESWNAGDDGGRGWEIEGWIGGDVNRLWLRGEGEHGGGDDSEVAVELLYGRGISAWWDVVAGVRHEHGDDTAHTWLAVGVQGLAPYKIETKATAYVDRRGRLAARASAEYETLLSSRWILQWEASVEAHGRRDLRDDEASTSGIGPTHVPDDGYGRHGAGIATIAAGARLRYEINRRIAPYLGVERERAYGGTADLRRAAGESIDDTRVVVGVRFWF